ncbi:MULTISPECIES: 3-methyl-2-oxobutanoate hydroxymethyltransferase [Caloramator]|uniref:3-methyl-2-oxobutanoate hydroxymethyltransferase n=1 Tax=Caloramator australicus RC3 TaxID=857293 RepID=I7J4U3_9CLOT|nr:MULTISPECIES: 3-methyl-2-oxobutanoate hydroxymethyltransferase [Caloramator]MDO6353935.1 3-methyl-2-oxobutanoate hydroxymethyltransferase [Caloramator sp. CAR-1]CCJ33036.1 3-methyl-2-oxobutanoate hydroxymethyltransferase [Caloramator australicus RC3]
MKRTVSSFKEAKQKGQRLTMLTAYDYSMAKLIDEAGIDGILVGDSLGMVALGYENTLSVTVDDMVHHIKAVARGAKNALIVGDMPFLSYHISIEESIKNAGRLIQEGGCHAVKLEGGIEVLDKVKAIIKAQIPVMGHIGLTPQSVNMLGGFKVQGKTKESIKKLIDDAKYLEDAGVFAIVLEAVPDEVAKLITESISIPTIGIGAGKYCDGQILVVNDMLGLFSDFVPKFVKKYRNLGDEIKGAIKEYIEEVRRGDFPEDSHSFKIDKDIVEEIKRLY